MIMLTAWHQQEFMASYDIAPESNEKSQNEMIIGILGGILDRKNPELIGKVLEQRFVRSPFIGQQALGKTTEIASKLLKSKICFNQKSEQIDGYFMTLHYDQPISAENLKKGLTWMKDNGVTLFITLDSDTDKLLLAIEPDLISLSYDKEQQVQFWHLQ